MAFVFFGVCFVLGHLSLFENEGLRTHELHERWESFRKFSWRMLQDPGLSSPQNTISSHRMSWELRSVARSFTAATFHPPKKNHTKRINIFSIKKIEHFEFGVDRCFFSSQDPFKKKNVGYLWHKQANIFFPLPVFLGDPSGLSRFSSVFTSEVNKRSEKKIPTTKTWQKKGWGWGSKRKRKNNSLREIHRKKLVASAASCQSLLRSLHNAQTMHQSLIGAGQHRR